MNIIADLRNSLNLPVFHDGRLGTLLDRSGHGITLGVGAGSGNKWDRTSRGYAFGGTNATELTAGVQASLDLTTATLFWAHVSYITHTSNINLISKSTGLVGGLLNGYTGYLSGGVGLALGDGVGIQTVQATFAEPLGQTTFVAFTWNGTNVSAYLNGNWVSTVAQTRVPSSVGRAYKFGWPAANGLRDVSLLFAGMSNRVLTGAEIARMYDEFLQDAYVLDLPRRNFVFMPQQGLGDAMETAQGLVLDTDFQRRSDGKIRDLGPNNYAGTITGAVVPGQNGEGAILPTINDLVDWGDVVALNSASQFAVEWWGELPSGNIPTAYFMTKYQNANNNLQIGPIDGLSTPKKLYFGIDNGAGMLGSSTATVVRAGTRQHFMCVFNGGLVGDANRSRMFVDGELVTQNYSLAVPASLPNLAGFNYKNGYANLTVPGTYAGQRVFSVAPSDAQVRQEYLNNFARKLLLRETLEDVPVTVGAAVGAGIYIGSSRVVSGTYKCSETTDGRRWLECITAGLVAIPNPYSFGTLVFNVTKADVSSFYLIAAAALPALFSDAAQTGYMFNIAATEQVLFSRVSGGAVAAFLAYTGANYLPTGSNYTITINRRPSDGRFTLFQRGGAFVAATALDVAGGGGANPTAAEATFTAGQWTVISMAAGDKMCGFDPNDTRVALLQVYQGVLNPWELP